MAKIIIIGGGWAGVSAAAAARQNGADVTIVEKTDLLLGTGNVGGIFRNNGRFTAAEEFIALGGDGLFAVLDGCALHRDIAFPGHIHASLYAVNLIEAHVRRYLLSLGVKLKMEHGVSSADCRNGRLSAVGLNSGERVGGDVFVETTGSSGPMGNCLRYGNGCVMCIQRCPAYGPRFSVSMHCGVPDLHGERAEDTPGVFSGSCKLARASLSHELRQQLDRDGVAILKLPPEEVNYEKLKSKACKQYALKEFSENVILLDTGDAKLMTSYYPLEKLRRVHGLENARFIDPYAGGKGNSIRYLSIAPRSNAMQVDGLENLFCGGEKSGPFIGHTEAIVTGALAGHNAVRHALGLPLLELPETLAVGDIISFANRNFKDRGDKQSRFTFSGGVFFERMKERGLYSTSVGEIHDRVAAAGLSGVFGRSL